MNTIIFGCVADDDTGATDEAGMFTQNNLRTVIIIGPPTPETMLKYSERFDAVIIAARTRSIAPEEAKHKTRMSLEALMTLKPKLYKLKYCSTFDSTPKGNIGPSIDAALETLDLRSTIVVPALPVNGRTTYMGHHFVYDQLLSESPIKDHPLNPMRESNLVTFLQKQTKTKVGLADYRAVKSGPEFLRQKFQQLESEGIAMIVIDAVDQEDLHTISLAAAENRLVTGSSGLAMELPKIFQQKGVLSDEELTYDHIRVRPGNRSVMVIAGSCSVATRKQNEFAKQRGYKSIKVDAEKLIRKDQAPSEIARVAKDAAKIINAEENLLLVTSNNPCEVEKNKQSGREIGLGDVEIGNAISRGLGAIAKNVLDQSNVNKVIIAGGETASDIVRELGLEALEVGKPIDPGVPCCFSLGECKLALALKSGHFGTEDFYIKAAKILSQYAGPK